MNDIQIISYGYSTSRSLTEELKIDQSFLVDLPQNTEDAAMSALSSPWLTVWICRSPQRE